MKRKIKFLAMAAAALTFAACSEELVPTPEQARNEAPESNVISFSTYMGRTGMTRAGATGSIDTDKLKEAKYGFGVFAYYTGKDTYGSYMRADGGLYKDEEPRVSEGDKTANFMFNQAVIWNDDLAENYVSKWEYSPLKYWPNEVATGAVDDQNNDGGNDPATTDYTNGGNVSFFAYAPYVDFERANWSNGIIAINGKRTLAEANAVEGDPTITYKVNTNGSEIVDLLWGTTSSNGKGVTEAPNAGVTSTAALDANNHVITTPTNAATYAAEILRSSTDATATGYTVNADLTKQKTTGTVGFAFKHALAKVGGSGTTTSTTSNGTTTTTTSGLQVMLDLDDQMGEETGGSKGDETKVTIRSITIDAYSLSEIATATNDDTPPTTTTTYKYMKSAEGVLNLATGKWQLNTETGNIATGTSTTTAPPAIPTDASKTTHTIKPEYETDKSATLNDLIAEAEYSSVSGDVYGFEEQPDGVLTTPQSVYKDEVNPLVFIPGTYPELVVTVDYIVRTQDANLNAGSTCVGQKITKRLTFKDAVQLNKQYSLVIRLGLTSVKFKATVSDWEVVGGTTSETGDDNTVTIRETEESHEIYVPRNVKGPKVSNFAINDNQATPAAITNITAGDAGKTVNFTVAGTKKKEGTEAIESNIAYDDIEVLYAPSWVTVTNTSDAHSISVTANTTNETREGTIALAVKDASNPEEAIIEIPVKQYGKLQVVTSATNFAATGVTNVAFVTSVKDTEEGNVTATYTIMENGTEVSGASVNSNGQITLPDNTTTSIKTMTVDVTATVEGEELHANQFTITQDAKALTITIAETGNIAGNGGTKTLKVDGSEWPTDYAGSSNEEWLTINNTNGQATAAANTTTTTRTATVTVTKDDASGAIDVTQDAGVVTVESITIGAGETKPLIVKVGGVAYLLKNTEAANRTITISDTSITVNAGDTQNTITVPAGTAAGTYTITVKLDDTETSAPATITVQ